MAVKIKRQSAQRRHQVVIQKQATVSDGMGSETTTWVTHLSGVFVSIWPISAREMIQSGQTTMTVSHRIRMNYISGITPDMRIKYGSRIFDIISIINVDERNKTLEFMAKEDID